ncbi:MAG: diaminopimelate epimerase [Candidatus Xenobia bacterium]
MEFAKMHGLGNDFIMLDATEQSLPPLPELAKQMCDRHFGVGADGLLIIEPSHKADIKMRIVNSDGSEAKMCGNGVRCAAAWVYEKGLVENKQFKIETLGGIVAPRLIMDGERVIAVEVNMGPPGLERVKIPMKGPEKQKVVREILEIDGNAFKITCLSMGNPHCVIFTTDVPGMPDLNDIPLDKWGPKIEKHPLFPEQINVEFVEIRGDGDLHARVWERGAGQTLACGTGACASLVAAHLNSLCRRKAKVTLPGGPLNIEWRDDGNIYMTGPTEKVMEGQYLIRQRRNEPGAVRA